MWHVKMSVPGSPHAADLNYFRVANFILYMKGRFTLEFHYPFDLDAFQARYASTDADVLTFVDFLPSSALAESPQLRVQEDDRAVLEISNFDEWWTHTEKRTRNMVRKLT